MKAAVVYGKNDVRFEEVEEPQIIENNQVKINVKACGICGSDIPRVLEGKAHYYPIILGHEFSGVIVEVGSEVKSLKVGDHVAAAPLIPCFNCKDCKKGYYSLCKNYTFIGSRIQGGLAEYVVVPETNAIKIDKSISFEQSALFEPSTVSLHALKLVNYHNENNVAIIGTGTIGLFALQWAKILGAKSITVFGRNDEKLRLCKTLGADNIINIKENYKEATDKSILNEGFDYVFEAVGKESTIHLAIEIAGNRSKVCLIGTPTSELTFTQKQWEAINRKELLLTGSWMSYSYPFPGEEWIKTSECFANGSLKFDSSMIYKTFPIEQTAKAFEEFKEKDKVKGRILIKNDL